MSPTTRSERDCGVVALKGLDELHRPQGLDRRRGSAGQLFFEVRIDETLRFPVHVCVDRHEPPLDADRDRWSERQSDRDNDIVIAALVGRLNQ